MTHVEQLAEKYRTACEDVTAKYTAREAAGEALQRANQALHKAENAKYDAVEALLSAARST